MSLIGVGVFLFFSSMVAYLWCPGSLAPWYWGDLSFPCELFSHILHIKRGRLEHMPICIPKQSQSVMILSCCTPPLGSASCKRLIQIRFSDHTNLGSILWTHHQIMTRLTPHFPLSPNPRPELPRVADRSPNIGRVSSICDVFRDT
jgi:hypothetical protein